MSKTYEIIGRVELVKPAQTFGSGFTKREIVVCDDDPRYPQHIAVSFAKEKIAALDQFQPGDHVAISFNIQGREYNDRHYVELRGYRIERAAKIGGEPTVGPAAPAAPQQGSVQPHGPRGPVVPAAAPATDSFEELPF